MTILEATLGLEIHIQINTKSKIFCKCSTKFGEKPNSNTCVICTSQPGTIPLLNKKAVEAIVKTGLALNFTINKQCIFARKQYFYPDIPKNYQITQLDPPICSNGKLIIISNKQKKIINMKRLHLEEDAGKLIHEVNNKKLNYSLLDLNRASIGLMELVTEPDFNSSEEVIEFLKEIKSIVEYLNVSECSMEEGKMRCDINVSVHPVEDKKLGTRVEIKNINSLSNIKDAIEYEIKRQKTIIVSNGKVIQETMLWDAKECVTKSMRFKEDTLDYRYFPEPDLVPLNLSNSFIRNLVKEIPELPKRIKLRFIKNYNLSEHLATYLISKKTIADYYEKALKTVKNPKIIAKTLANWISTELSAKLNSFKISIEDSPITCKNLAKLVSLIVSGSITRIIAKEIFEEMWKRSQPPEIIIKRKKIQQISDELTIIKMCEEAIIKNHNAVKEFISGKNKAMDAIIGFVMKKSKGLANPLVVNKILLNRLKKL
ncbi:MAG: Asp-tRNA(Asn)/Glu-tRNA(Gln) amidotransferase subunit GatB [Endomicrobium sp.]|jgi:aspartyl-tRNA(Asn)/glutamyl-tRNA(Gln) amidotransferase subunit B|nr:Asp-tRNA(Asn)/Glu-tRNA(Gln) amidotransferase subunit GatB [Endomicrobium sp.]